MFSTGQLEARQKGRYRLPESERPFDRTHGFPAGVVEGGGGGWSSRLAPDSKNFKTIPYGVVCVGEKGGRGWEGGLEGNAEDNNAVSRGGF